MARTTEQTRIVVTCGYCGKRTEHDDSADDDDGWIKLARAIPKGVVFTIDWKGTIPVECDCTNHSKDRDDFINEMDKIYR
jgi:hypothetical protein